MIYYSKVFLLIVIFYQSTFYASSDQQTNEFGYADPSVTELAQYEYLRGNWRIEMEMLNKDGKFQKLPNPFFLKGYFHSDHRTFQSVFTSEKGFFSTDIRSFNKETGKWKVLFLNAKAQRWHSFEASLEDNKMTTIVLGGYSGKESFDIKAVHYDITENSFSGNVYRSIDSGKTWQHVYKMRFNKI